MWSPCILPVTDTVCQSLPVLELACWRNVPLGSSIMYTDRWTSKRTTKYFEVTLQSLYFSRTVVDTPLAPGVSMDRLRSPVKQLRPPATWPVTP